ncbi:oxidoreductase [Vibrio sp. IRLE0018]|uniref:oxidoreductase n=1 Tax=Vibrio floridensis TaxID=2908007 RepID=UPI001A1AE803|nr:oxidoreductase [Vibrio floridensis]MCF8778342.1 oxidoreductase [Vibrio floridensis]HAS6151294.1 NAD(P)H-binding protein [Vibrio vulnificus]
MTIRGENTAVIVAGGTGLVGSQLIAQILPHEAISTLYALTRRQITVNIPQAIKLVNLIEPDLLISDWPDERARPTVGFICLGTTKKQAGSQEQLRQIDVELVCQVAQTMKLLGVTRVAVVSSLGADAQSRFHYLKCKGQMERALMNMGFEQLVIVRPGPLKGQRHASRSDEKWLQRLMRPFIPLMRGKLRNYTPIDAKEVALAMLYRVFAPHPQKVEILHKNEMVKLLGQYR